MLELLDRNIDRLKVSGVVLHVVFQRAVAPAGIEVIHFHFLVSLIEIPSVLGDSINSAHHPGAVAAARAMHKEATGGRIVCEFQELVYLLISRTAGIANRNV